MVGRLWVRGAEAGDGAVWVRGSEDGGGGWGLRCFSIEMVWEATSTAGWYEITGG